MGIEAIGLLVDGDKTEVVHVTKDTVEVYHKGSWYTKYAQRYDSMAPLWWLSFKRVEEDDATSG